MTPYFTQHRPPALVAALPPIEHISNEDGIRRVPQSLGRRGLLHLDVERTGLGHGHPAGGVDASISRIRSRHSTMPPSTAVEPPDSPQPAPRGTTGTSCRGRPDEHRLDVGGARRPDHGQRPAGSGIAGPVLAVGRR